VFEKAMQISAQEAEARITEQVYRLNPSATVERVQKFIRG